MIAEKCVLAVGPDGCRINKAGFIRTCKARRTNNKKSYSKYGKDWLARQQCTSCPTAVLVDSGLDDFTPPSGVVFIELKKEVEKMAAEKQKDFLGSETLKAIPAGKYSRISLVGLKGYWKKKVLVGKKEAPCPNCGLVKINAGAGVCNVCYQAGRNFQGPTLIKRLESKVVQARMQEDEQAKPDTVKQDNGLVQHQETVAESAVKSEPEKQSIIQDKDDQFKQITQSEFPEIFVKAQDDSATLRDIQFALVRLASNAPTNPTHSMEKWALRVNDQATRLTMQVAKMEARG